MPRTKPFSSEKKRTDTMAVIDYCMARKNQKLSSATGLGERTIVRRRAEPEEFSLGDIRKIVKGVELSEEQMRILIGG